MDTVDFGFVYSCTNVTSVRSNLFKIGSTNDLSRRMRDLSSASGVPDPFREHESFVFESRIQAAQVESEVHSLLDSEGNRYAKNREFFYLKRSLGSYVRPVARRLGIATLSSYHIQQMFSDFGTSLPCAYFLLSPTSEFQRFRETIEWTYSALSEFGEYPSDLKHDLARCVAFQCSQFEDEKSFLRRNFNVPILVAVFRAIGEQLAGLDDNVSHRFLGRADALEDACADKIAELFGHAN